MRAVVLLNPAARGGRAGRARPALAAALAESGVSAEIVETTGPGAAEAAAREAAASADLVVAAGGDGTVHEVLNGVVGGEASFGVVPLGTGNDYALALGVPAGLEAACAALATAEPFTVDVGRVEWTDTGGEAHVRHFANGLGAGFDAHAARLAGDTKWLGGRTAYLAAIARTLWAWRRPSLRVRVTVGDAAVFENDLFLCEIANGHSVGGGFLLAPDARIDDGLLDACIVRHVSTGRALRLLPTTFSGAHVGAPEVRMERAPRIVLEVLRGTVALQADGESLSLGAVHLVAEAVPGALTVRAPGRAALRESVAPRGARPVTSARRESDAHTPRT